MSGIIDEREALDRKAQAANCAATVLADECGKLRKRVEELEASKDFYLAGCGQAERLLEKEAEKCDALQKRVEELERELAEWHTLRGWGGTPAHVEDFIKGQQQRIHAAQIEFSELTAAQERIKELEAKASIDCELIKSTARANGSLQDQLAAERAAHLATQRALAKEAKITAPLRIEYPVIEFISLSSPDENGLVKMMGRWAEDGSPYFFYLPHQLVESFLGLQRLATHAAAARAAVAKADAKKGQP